MKIKTILLTFWILIILSGCISTNDTIIPLETIEFSQIEPTQSIKTAVISQITETKTTNSNTPIALSTLDNKNFQVQLHCPEIKPGLDKVQILPGTIVFGAENVLIKGEILTPQQDYDSKLTFWTPIEDEIKAYDLIEDELYYYFSESPDKENLAFTQGKTRSMIEDLFVVNNLGEENYKFSIPEEWTFFHWLNNEEILFRQIRMANKETTRDEYDLISLNIFDNEQKSLSSDLPDIYLMEDWWQAGSNPVFNQENTFAFYLLRQYNTTDLYSVIWDLKQDKEVKRIAGSGVTRWSPTDDSILLAIDFGKHLSEDREELFIINTDGQSKQATYFSDYYDSDANYWFALPVWSPEGKKIAFWIIRQAPVENAQLAVLDLETSRVDLYCKKINPYPNRFSWDTDSQLGSYVRVQVNSAPPLWSPDGRYLLIEDKEKSLLFDTENFTITQIAENARPVGWLK